MRYAYLLILIVCWLSACESNLAIRIPYEPKPVLSTLMNKDSTIFVRVTLSTRMDPTRSNFPEPDAVVQLFEDGQFKETLVRVPGPGGPNYYTSAVKMQLGRTYRVTADIPGYATIEGTDIIPDTVAVGELQRVEVINPNDSFYATHKVAIQLRDKAGERNYYRIRVFLGSYLYVWPGGITTIVQRADQSEYFRLEEIDLNPFGSKERNDFFIDDALFDGKNPVFKFSLTYPFAIGKDGLLIAEISNLTYDAYRYLQTAHEAEVKRGDPLVEKILVYNNVKNGLGIVGGGGIREYIIPK